ncbi:hypothetical protein [Amycolatopsis sp. NPDC102389]|uniref:hypothetical protein n=1 Tax=Amycolatopsis sp. NPDC102389 TaxID=3363941 RepID=UPI00381E00FC
MLGGHERRHRVSGLVPVEQDAEEDIEVGRVVDVGIRRRESGEREDRDRADTGGHETGAAVEARRQDERRRVAVPARRPGQPDGLRQVLLGDPGDRAQEPQLRRRGQDRRQPVFTPSLEAAGEPRRGGRLARDGGTGVNHFFGFGQHSPNVIG